jgi:hypothetical protein
MEINNAFVMTSTGYENSCTEIIISASCCGLEGIQLVVCNP